jgi:hypothetical protein
MNGRVFSLCSTGSELYAAGEFTTAGGTNANRIAKWNGSQWFALGTGLNFTAYALCYSTDGIFVGGGFTTAGNIQTAYYIARYSILTGITGHTSAPEKFKLYQNYPNPFNPVTKISFDLPKTSNVTLVVFDSRGKEVKSYRYENLSSGSYSEIFDGNGISSGVYFYRIHAGDFSQTNKMILLK